MSQVFTAPVDPLPKLFNPDDHIGEMLKGKKILVVGVANELSIAYGVAAKLHAFGARVAITCQNEKAKRFVQACADKVEAEIFLPLDVTVPGQLAEVKEVIVNKWGTLDAVVHSIAFAPLADLQGRVTDISLEGFQAAMRISAYSFPELVKEFEPIVNEGGAFICMSYYGAIKVVKNYGLMGLCKAALEAATRYMSVELAPRNIGVYAISPGPIKTRAAGGLKDFDELTADAIRRSPSKKLVAIDEVGRVASLLVSGALSSMSGQTLYVDHGCSTIY
jgi:enoyl-[acyl-carrier protein] reductase I